MNLLAIEIGGSKLQLFAGTDGGQILDRRRFPVDRAAGGEGIRKQIAAALPELVEKWEPPAVGIGDGGPGGAWISAFGRMQKRIPTRSSRDSCGARGRAAKRGIFARRSRRAILARKPFSARRWTGSPLRSRMWSNSSIPKSSWSAAVF